MARRDRPAATSLALDGRLVIRSELSELHYIAPVDNVASIVGLGLLSHHGVGSVSHVSVAMSEIPVRPLARALVEVEVPQLSGDPMPLIYGLTGQPTLDWDALQATEEFFRRKTPVSDLLHVRLRPLTTPYVSDEDRFDTLFDDLEWPPMNPVLRSHDDLMRFHESFWARIRNPEFPRPNALGHLRAAEEDDGD